MSLNNKIENKACEGSNKHFINQDTHFSSLIKSYRPITRHGFDKQFPAQIVIMKYREC